MKMADYVAKKMSQTSMSKLTCQSSVLHEVSCTFPTSRFYSCEAFARYVVNGMVSLLQLLEHNF